MKTIIKKIIYTILLVMMAMLFISCEKDDTIKPNNEVNYHQELVVKETENPMNTIQNNFNWDFVYGRPGDVYINGFRADGYVVFTKPYEFKNNKKYKLIIEHKDNLYYGFSFLKQGNVKIYYKSDTITFLSVRMINSLRENSFERDTTLTLLTNQNYSTKTGYSVIDFNVNIKPEHQRKPIRLLIRSKGIEWGWANGKFNYLNAKLLESN